MGLGIRRGGRARAIGRLQEKFQDFCHSERSEESLILFMDLNE